MLRRIVVHFRSSIGTINVGVTEGCATQKTPAKVGDELDNDGEKQRCSEQWWRFAFLSLFLSIFLSFFVSFFLSFSVLIEVAYYSTKMYYY